MARPKRTITDEEKAMFLALKPEDIDQELFDSLFSDTVDPTQMKKNKDGVLEPKIIPSRFNTYDEFKLKAGEYFNTTDITTNCGLFIFNKFLIEPYFQKEVGYVNFPITKKARDNIDHIIEAAILLDDTGDCIKRYVQYMNRMCWLAFTLNTQICSSLSIKSSTPLASVEKRKKELIQKHKKEIEANDAIAYKHITDELVSLAQKEMESDPSYELYASGARGAFDNAYRQWLITKGPVYNAYKGEFEIITESLYEGIPKENVPTISNAVIHGFYYKSIAPGSSGYMAKKLAAGFQDVVLDERNSDCKTSLCAFVELTEDNLHYYMYNFIKSGSKYIRLEPSNQSSYIGKVVQMRLPECCIGKKLCNRCAGDRYYLLGIDNMGLTFNRVANSTLRAKMKKSHDSTVRTYILDPDKIFGE